MPTDNEIVDAITLARSPDGATVVLVPPQRVKTKHEKDSKNTANYLGSLIGLVVLLWFVGIIFLILTLVGLEVMKRNNISAGRRKVHKDFTIAAGSLLSIAVVLTVVSIIWCTRIYGSDNRERRRFTV